MWEGGHQAELGLPFWAQGRSKASLGILRPLSSLAAARNGNVSQVPSEKLIVLAVKEKCLEESSISAEVQSRH